MVRNGEKWFQNDVEVAVDVPFHFLAHCLTARWTSGAAFSPFFFRNSLERTPVLIPSTLRLNTSRLPGWRRRRPRTGEGVKGPEGAGECVSRVSEWSD